MKTAEFEFRVPARLIPIRPPELRGKRRDDARLVVLDRKTEKIHHAEFRDLKSWLEAGDALVVNDSMVTHDQLLKDVWSASQRDNIQYLRILVRKLRQKIEADPNHPRLLITESGIGYRLCSSSENTSAADAKA